MKETMRLWFIGDIFGRQGRTIVTNKFRHIVQTESIDFVIANGENSAGGLGITPEIAKHFFTLGIDVITSGNHIWSKKEIYEYINANHNLIRPANYVDCAPGRGYTIITKNTYSVAVINLLGRVFIPDTDCPFRKFDAIYETIKSKAKIIVVDFHAEATSEKMAFAYHTAGRVSAVIGTHTHVQTNDCRIFDNHTAYISDAGMTGPYNNSVIGVDKNIVLRKFLTGLPSKFEPADSSVMQLNSIIIDINISTGSAIEIKHCNIIE